MDIKALHAQQGAHLAPDGIPLEYGDLAAEYRAALTGVVLMDRSHEGRLEISGRDRLEIIQRISTNELSNLALHAGAATIFTNANGRILDRAEVYNRGEVALIIGEPGRGSTLHNFLGRQIFFNDEAAVRDLGGATHLFTLHGPKADAVMEALRPGAGDVPLLHGLEVTVADIPVFAVRRKPVSETCWTLLVPQQAAAEVWSGLLQAGQPHQLRPAGSLTFNTLRIRAGRPGIGRELSADYIPLEAGLWDEVSFTKGCYTGQEIIARMESRGKLAKTMVMLRLDRAANAPADLFHEGKNAGTLTSSVTTPEGEHLGIGFVRLALAEAAAQFTVGDGQATADLTALAGAQPPSRAG